MFTTNTWSRAGSKFMLLLAIDRDRDVVRRRGILLAEPPKVFYKKSLGGSAKVGIPFVSSKPSFGDNFGDSSPPTATCAPRHRHTTEHRPCAPRIPGDVDTVIFTGGVSLRPSVQNPPRYYIRKSRGFCKSRHLIRFLENGSEPLIILRPRFLGVWGAGARTPGTTGHVDGGLRGGCLTSPRV